MTTGRYLRLLRRCMWGGRPELDRLCEWAQIRKNLRVCKIFVRNSGAGNGCANFMDAWKKCVRSAGKTVSIKFLVLGGGGYFGFWGGGGSADFIFMGARIFLIKGVSVEKGPFFHSEGY